MSWRRAVAAAIVTWIVIGFMGVAILTRQGFAVRRSPGRVESFVAEHLRDIAIPSDQKRLPNPLAKDSTAWEAGRDEFAVHCAVCHDADGRGRGYVARHLDPPAPDLSAAQTQELTDGALYYIITKGVRWTGMPAWGEEGSAEERWQLVAYIRHLATAPAPSGGSEAHGDTTGHR